MDNCGCGPDTGVRLKPYAGLSKTRLVDLLNSVNGSSKILGTDFNISGPLASTEFPGRNTKVSVTVLKDTKYVTPQDVFYTRLNLSVLGKLPKGFVKPVFIPNLPFTIHELLPEINEALGIDLITNEVSNVTYNTKMSTYRITIRETISHAWVGYYEFNASFIEDLIELRCAIKNQIMEGFTYNPVL